jgi:hypothetical protein
MPSVNAVLLVSLTAISHETRTMLLALDEPHVEPSNRREARRRVLEIVEKVTEYFDWLDDVWIDAPRN